MLSIYSPPVMISRARFNAWATMALSVVIALMTLKGNQPVIPTNATNPRAKSDEVACPEVEPNHHQHQARRTKHQRAAQPKSDPTKLNHRW